MRSPHTGRGCGDSKQTDTALFLLARLWQRAGESDRAVACLERISAEHFDSRIIGLLDLLGQRKEYRRLRQVGETTLWRLLTMMNVVCRLLSASMTAEGMQREVLALLDAQENLLGIFDGGLPRFLHCRKIYGM